jgi:hypothetical protein
MLTTRTLHTALLGLAALTSGSALAGPAGTTIEVTKTAKATWTQINTYNWQISKTPQFPDQVTYVVLPGETVQAGFTIKATRFGPRVEIRNTPISGEICITNTGLRTTQNLYLEDRLEVLEGGIWTPAHPQFVIPVGAEIAPGASQCFAYSITIEIDPNKEYRNVATASIDNYLEAEGTNFQVIRAQGVDVTVDVRDINASVTVRDTFTCEAGFECSSMWTDQLISNTETFTYTESVKNVSAPCGETVVMTNTASLDYGFGSEPESIPVGGSATATFYTGTCRVPPTQ